MKKTSLLPEPQNFPMLISLSLSFFLTYPLFARVVIFPDNTPFCPSLIYIILLFHAFVTRCEFNAECKHTRLLSCYFCRSRFQDQEKEHNVRFQFTVTGIYSNFTDAFLHHKRKQDQNSTMNVVRTFSYADNLYYYCKA